MPTPFLDKLRTAAAAAPSLQALLTAGSVFQWFDTQLPQSAQVISPSPVPAVVVQEISAPPTYLLAARANTRWRRIQFTIWGGQFSAGAENCESVQAALEPFLDTLNLSGISGNPFYPNYVVSVRRGLFPQTDGPIYQKLMDAMMFANDSL